MQMVIVSYGSKALGILARWMWFTLSTLPNSVKFRDNLCLGIQALKKFICSFFKSCGKMALRFLGLLGLDEARILVALRNTVSFLDFPSSGCFPSTRFSPWYQIEKWPWSYKKGSSLRLHASLGKKTFTWLRLCVWGKPQDNKDCFCQDWSSARKFFL